MSNIKIHARPVEESELINLIEFDDVYLQKAMEKSGVPLDQLAPSLTLIELKNARINKDIIEWIMVDRNLVGYYWFEKKVNYLYINGVAIRPEFKGNGIIQQVLEFADKYAQKNHLLKCMLSVSPLNGRALNVYFKYGYRVTKSVPAYFGPEYPVIFRIIMEKNLSDCNETCFSEEESQIQVDDYHQLKHATDNGYIGIRLIKSESNSCENKICFVKLL